jgi:hypothetical protein
MSRAFTDFMVYEHWRSDTDQCFYVGKGRRVRPTEMSTRSERHKRVVAKLKRDGHSVIVKIVDRNLPEVSAFLLERMRIATYRAKNIELVNFTDGGGGISGYKHTPEARAKIKENNAGNQDAVRASRSERMKRDNPMRRKEVADKVSRNMMGKSLSAASVQKLSKSLTGRKLSTEHKEKLKAAVAKRVNPMKDPIIRAKVSAKLTGKPGPLLGKKLSPEWRENIKRGWEKRRAAKQIMEANNVA